MTVMDQELQALLALLKASPKHPTGTPERRRWVADQAGVSADNLYQVARGIPLASGRRRQLGRDVKERLSAAFPGWLDTVATPPEITPPTVIPLPAPAWPHERFPQSYWESLTQAERAVVEEAMLDAYDRLMARREQLRTATGKTARPAA